MKKALWGFFIFFLLSILYFRLILNDPILMDYDDKILLDPLYQINTILDYSNIKKAGLIYDIQPIRDLSLWIDIQFIKIIPFASFHLTNVVIWFATILLIYFTLLKLKVSNLTASIASTLYVVHPVFVNSIAWIAARKHILSTFFIVAATYFLICTTTQNAELKKIKNSTLFVILLLYFLACFSHPINVFWPVFAVIYWMGHGFNPFKSKQGFFSMLGLSLIGGICIYLNQKYYTGIYIAQNGGVEKYIDTQNDNLGIKLLAFGRYFLQTVFPAWPTMTSPYPGSYRNILGLAFFPFFILILKKFGTKESCYWLLYFILPLSTVLLKMTAVFASDTYLLNASLGLFIPIALIIESNKQKISLIKTHIFKSFIFLIFISLFIKSIQISKAWESSLNLWGTSYEIEATPTNTTQYGINLIEAGEYEKAFELALEVKAWRPQQKLLPVLFSRSIFENPRLSIKKKIEILEKNKMNSPYFSYILGGLYASQSNFKNAFHELEPQLKNTENFCFYLSEAIEIVAAEVYFICTKSGEQKCDSIISKLRNHFQTHPYLRIKPWDESALNARLKELGVKQVSSNTL